MEKSVSLALLALISGTPSRKKVEETERETAGRLAPPESSHSLPSRWVLYEVTTTVINVLLSSLLYKLTNRSVMLDNCVLRITVSVGSNSNFYLS